MQLPTSEEIMEQETPVETTEIMEQTTEPVAVVEEAAAEGMETDQTEAAVEKFISSACIAGAEDESTDKIAIAAMETDTTESESKEQAADSSADTTTTTTIETNSADTSANTSIVQSTEEKMNQLEELYKDRYTENDKEYAACLNKTEQKPPIVPDFGGRSDSHSSRRDNRDKSSTRHRSRSRSPEKPPKRVGKHGIISFYSLYY